MSKILLVEDDNNLREIYGARLSAEGYDIMSAKDGEEALAIAVKEKPDLIITDVMMPRISGFDMLDILRNAPETKDTKVIMMTALSQAEDKARADKLGADMYLVKSQVTLEDVAKAVGDILNPDAKTKEQPTADSGVDQSATSTLVPAVDVSASAVSSSPEEPADQPATQETQTQPTSSGQTPSPVQAASATDSAPASDLTNRTPSGDSTDASTAQTAVAPVADPVDSQPVTSSSSAPVLEPVQPAPDQPQPSPPPVPEVPETPPAPDQPLSAAAPNNSVLPRPLTTSTDAKPPEEPIPEPQNGVPPQAEPSTETPIPSSQLATAPIQVVLPGDNSNDAQNPDNSASLLAGSNSESIGSQTVDTPMANIGPNLAEALADEEKSGNEQAESFQKKFRPPPPPAPPIASNNQATADTSPSSPALPTETAEPQTSSPEPEPAIEQPPTQVISSRTSSSLPTPVPEPENVDIDSPRSNIAEERPRIESDDDSDASPKKKVLQPSEEFLKGGPDINDLLTKEMAGEGIKPPDPTTVLKDPSSKGQKDPDQVIDEIEKTNQEINKIAL